MLKGASVVTVHVKVPPPVFLTVKDRFFVDPTGTYPKFRIDGVTWIMGIVGGTEKEAVTVLSESMVIWQSAVPEQAPAQPVNTKPADGVAVRFTWVPGSYTSIQSLKGE